MGRSWEDATREQYVDEANLAARQAIFEHLVRADPMPPPLGRMADLAGRRVLDIGCGNGLFLTGAVDAGANAVGLDFSRGMLEASRTTGVDAPLVQAGAETLPVASSSVDVVLALWMLYHVDDQLAAVAEFARVLGPDGLLVATTNAGRRSFLDDIVCEALGAVLFRPVDRWHAPLSFVSENGADIIRTAFDDVAAVDVGNEFEVADVAPIVRYVGSLIGPVQEEHGAFDIPAFLTEVGHRVEREIAPKGTFAFRQVRTVFLARH